MKYSRYIGGLVLITALISGCQQETPAMRGPTVPAVSYITVTSSSHNIDTQMQARVVASQVAEVRPQVSGIIQQRQFEEGNLVEQGQLLYQIDPASYQSAYNEAKANLNSAKAALHTAKLKDQRYAKLIKLQGIAQQDADDAHAAYLEAKANIEKFEDLAGKSISSGSPGSGQWQLLGDLVEAHGMSRDDLSEDFSSFSYLSILALCIIFSHSFLSKFSRPKTR